MKKIKKLNLYLVNYIIKIIMKKIFFLLMLLIKNKFLMELIIK